MLLSGRAQARERWSELNIGPFYVDSQGSTASARDVLTRCEQTRWVLGNLLDSQDLRSLWPIRIVLDPKASPVSSDFAAVNGQWLLVTSSPEAVRPGSVARILLEANSPRWPADAEGGLLALFDTMQAHGSHVEWGGRAPYPDLAWARMQLFATRFEYRASLHVLVTSLKNGSSLPVAERNAFGHDPAALEAEAQKNLSSHDWQPIAVSGRPLDPKRDFGEHAIDAAVVDTYLGDAFLTQDPRQAERLYKAAIETGGPAKGLGYAGLAALAKSEHADPKAFLESAIASGLLSAPLFVEAAQFSRHDEALVFLKRAQQLNPLWAVPVYEESKLAAADPAHEEKLLSDAAHLDQRQAHYWTELAQLQTENGHAIEAQGSWLRAEDAAANRGERERIEKMRLDSEEGRLNAADAERLRAETAVHREDTRAQDAEAQRIRAAEQKANQSLDQAAGGDRPETVVPWDATLPQRKLTGVVTQVDCLRGAKRLTVADRSGKKTALLLESAATKDWSCGAQAPPKHVALSYAADPNDRLHTAGRVLSLTVQ